MNRATLHARLSRLRAPLILWRAAQPDCLISIELRQSLPVAAFGVLLAWYVAAPTGVTAMALAALGGLLVIAYMWARLLAWHVRARRRLRYAAVQVGDELEEQISLDNAAPLPVLWAEFADQSDLPGYTVNSVRAAGGHNSIRWRVRAECPRHGVFRLGPWELRLGDPFGLFLVRQTYTQQQELLVYPPLAALPDDFLPHHATPGDHRPLHQPLPAETIHAAYTRPYLPGDPLRHLHWRTTARRDAPYAKVFEPEATSTVWLVPDFDPAVHPTTLPHSSRGESVARETEVEDSETTMVILTASLANRLLRSRLAVGLLAYTDRLTVVSPQLGQPHLWKVLRALAGLRLTCAWPLAETLRRVQSLISSRDLVIVVTPSINPDWPRELRRITHRGGGAEAIVLDPASFGGQAQGVEACARLLAELGLARKVVRRGEVRPSRGAYGALRRWEFMTLGTGRAVARQTPRSSAERLAVAPEPNTRTGT